MKKLIIVAGFLCFSLFAFAGGGEKNTFAALSFGSSFSPANKYNYSGTAGALTYGHRVTPQSFGVVGISLSDAIDGGLLFGYEQEFVSDGNWLPGANVSLLVGVAGKSNKSIWDDNYSPTLGLGADIGLFLKIGPSTGKLQGVAQTGVKYLSAVSSLSESFKDKLEHYISVALRLNF